MVKASEEEESSARLLTEDHDSECLGYQVEDAGGDLESRRPSLPQSHRRRTPLPLAQLVILCAVRMVEPMAYSQIFPVRDSRNVELEAVIT